MTNEEIITHVVAMSKAGLDIAKLTDDLIAELQHQEIAYEKSEMSVSNKDRAELVVRMIFERYAP